MEAQEWLLYFTVGPLMVLLSAIFKAFPPKKINMWYGYRTERSMRNQTTWDEANRYANNFMVWLFIIISLIDIALFLTIKSTHAALIGCGLLTVGLILLVLFTEKHLKDKFD